MKDIIRNGLILAIICAVAAGALAFTNEVTSAVIEQRIYDETVAELEDLFPAIEDFEEKEVDGYKGFVAYDADGNYIGVLAEGRTEGYGGTIRFNLGVNDEGEIVGVTVISQSETAGLGDVITGADYLAQFEGLGLEDDIADHVDVISGATVSTRAMINGVGSELMEIVLRFGDADAVPDAPTVDMGALEDGTYTGTASGFKSDITVEVTVSGGEITDITVTDHDDTPNIFADSEQVIDDIIAGQSLDVDVVSGATGSSNGIKNAVLNALAQ
ncbi:FMN-binding protein [Dethiobacter alkaliphilus]|uniref:FMN-binding protein n=1 Tax=Dethiobacter alkaliphilus TaxID=427926 RepID=UPI0022261E79|nr:FMN-binding protein [Dethiobacter alkaliphilus]MCW3491372.1 FMN-binding protein [Dethiobacter alkaliphilus]